MSVGTVYLIGAGPGDPGLITVRGMELLRQADVVVYDRLTHPALLSYVAQRAERVYVGKASAHHSMKQPEINALLVERAQRGLKVVRLKGGDPFVFGRGGEEADECQIEGIPFEIVPGVTSAIAAPAYAGIPITHRDAASSFAVITGHERDDQRESGTREPGRAEPRRDWAKIAHGADTLIFLMGVEALPEISARLIEYGRDPVTPVALVQWGTWTRQRVVVGNLSTIVDIVKQAGLTPPAVCVVGEVVKLRDSLRWFDNPMTRPLFGKRIVVTRAREQASELSDLLRVRGADPVEFPVIRIQRMRDPAPLDEALSRLTSFDWMIVTSANTVPILAERMETMRIDARAFAGLKIAAIGPATAEAMRMHLGLRADYVPSEAVAEAVLAQWPDNQMTGKRVLLPRAAEARELLPEGLEALGATVEVIAAYQTLADSDASEEFLLQLEQGKLDAITFTASSTVKNFARSLADVSDRPLSDLLKNITLAAIGPVTGAALRDLGLLPSLIAEEHTIPGLVSALESHQRALSS